MGLLENLSPWILGLLIVVLRVVDVSLGTMRTIFVVHGRIRLSVVLGFFEVLVWITAVSQVITLIREVPWLMLAYSLGFALGNAVGIALEKRLAIGHSVLRMISDGRGMEIAMRLRAMGQRVTTFEGRGREGRRILIYALCPRRDARGILETAREIDPDVFYYIERASEVRDSQPFPHATGWRAVFKKK
jgi:uncharacterized protein YebE (UPF0316 family)